MEEAGTRILLHAKNIDEENNVTNIVIQTPDTDVFMISLGVAEHVRAIFSSAQEHRTRHESFPLRK